MESREKVDVEVEEEVDDHDLDQVRMRFTGWRAGALTRRGWRIQLRALYGPTPGRGGESRMLSGKRIAVVVPARDEERHLGSVLATMPGWVDDVIVVDDASRDGTAELALAAGPPVRLLRRAQNGGVGAAIAAGYRAAEQAGAEVVAVMAGDGQMAAQELWAVVGPVAAGEYDYVKGDRLSHPEATRRMPLVRRLGTRALTLLTRWVTGYADLRDAQCGFTAVSAAAIRALPLQRLYPRYGYPNDLLALLASIGATVGQRTVTPLYADEASGIRPHVALFTHSWVLARAAGYRLLSRLHEATDPRSATRDRAGALASRRPPTRAEHRR